MVSCSHVAMYVAVMHDGPSLRDLTLVLACFTRGASGSLPPHRPPCQSAIGQRPDLHFKYNEFSVFCLFRIDAFKILCYVDSIFITFKVKYNLVSYNLGGFIEIG